MYGRQPLLMLLMRLRNRPRKYGFLRRILKTVSALIPEAFAGDPRAFSQGS